MPAITTAPPTSCVGPNVSPNQAHATTVATTGSSVATIEARVALMCRRDPVSSEKVTIVPMTTMKLTSTQTGAVYSDRFPCSETLSPSTLRTQGWGGPLLGRSMGGSVLLTVAAGRLAFEADEAS